MAGGWSVPRVTAGRAAAVLLLGVVLAFYTWTVATSTNLGLHQQRTDPYNALSDAFLDGHTALPIKVPPGLLALPNPYNPYANAQYRTSVTHDLILEDGRFYSYWGPAPALVLFIPFRALGLGDLPPGIAILVFSFVGLLLSLAILRLAVQRWLPQTPPWMVFVAAGLLATANVAPWVLRRPIQYEVAISGAFCFLQAGLLLALTGALRDRPDWRRLGAASLCFGLAFATRPPLGIGIAAAAVIFWWWRRQGTLAAGPPTKRAAAILFGPWAACVFLIAVYNQIRFGSPSSFGIEHQLAAIEISKKTMYVGSYLIPGLWYYLLAPVRWQVQFPFVSLPSPPGPPFSLPGGYLTPVRTAGLLTNVPLLLMLAAGPWALRDRARELRALVWGFVAIGVVVLGFVAVSLWTVHQRYEMDFATLFLVPACLVWFAVYDRLRPQLRVGRAVAAVGTILALYGALVGVAASMSGERDALKLLHPGTFKSLGDFFDPVGVMMTTVAGHPVIATIEGDPAVGPRSYGQLGVDGASAMIAPDDPLRFEVVSPSSGTVVIRGRFTLGGKTSPSAKLKPLALLGESSAGGRPIDGGVQEFTLRTKRGRNKGTLILSVGAGTAVGANTVQVDDLRVSS